MVVLTTFADQRRILDALDAGASGYLFKDAEPDEMIAAVRTVLAGGAPLDPKAARVLLDARRTPPPGRQLSSREREVLALLATGLANKQIARRLGIAERTVKAHLTSIFQQLGVTDRTQAALWAQTHLDERCARAHPDRVGPTRAEPPPIARRCGRGPPGRRGAGVCPVRLRAVIAVLAFFYNF